MKANHNDVMQVLRMASTVSNGSKIAIKTGSLTLIGFLEEKHEINRRKVNIFNDYPHNSPNYKITRKPHSCKRKVLENARHS